MRAASAVAEREIGPAPEAAEELRTDFLRCCKEKEWTLPARWLYDHRGSELFDKITHLPEYYPTRTELALLREAGAGLRQAIGHDRMLVEFGAGSAAKTPALIEAINPARYVPIDVSGDYLRESSVAVAERFPALEITPIEADFNRAVPLPRCQRRLPIIGFFAGSTIGNLEPMQATDLLRRMGETLGEDALLLIGMDRVKPLEVLIPAYNDAQGVTADFNLNLLTRVNRELGADIPVPDFTHEARWNDARARIEMHLVARRDVFFSLGDADVTIRQGESLHTENSHKYRFEEARMLLRCGGWDPIQSWSAPDDWFTLFLARRDVPDQLENTRMADA